MSGEPLSEERLNFWLNSLDGCWDRDGDCDRGDALIILRAFAREIQQAERYDWPEYDGTDAAHPAWWRGQEDGARGVAMLVKASLNGDAAGTCPPPIQELRERISTLLASQESCRSLAEALARFGKHERDCAFHRNADPCTCGLWTALSAYRSSEAGRGKV